MRNAIHKATSHFAATSAAAALLFAVGCSSKEERALQTIVRDRDAAAVVIVRRSSNTNEGGRVSYTTEVEPNNVIGEVLGAASPGLPGGVHGVLDGAGDVDLFLVTVEANSELSVRLDGIQGVDLVLELRRVGADGSSMGEVLARSDRGPAKTSEGLPNFPVTQGRYVIAVSEFVKKSKPRRRRKKRRKDKKKPGRTGPSAQYSLAVTLRRSDRKGATSPDRRNREREPNEDSTTTGELVFGVDAFGYIGWRGDRDRWRLTLDGAGTGSPTGALTDYGIDVDVAGVAGVRLELVVLDDNADVVVKRSGGKGEAVAVRGLIPISGHEHYYFDVGGRGSNPDDAYAIQVNSRLLEIDEEREPNDSAKTAWSPELTADALRGHVRGYLLAGDSDWFRLPAGLAGRTLTVSVTPPAELDVTLTLQSAGGTVLGQANLGKKGEVETLAAVPVPAGAAGASLVVRVSGKGSSDALNPYSLNWAVGGASAPADMGESFP